MCVIFLFLTQFIQVPLNLESATSIKTLIIKPIFFIIIIIYCEGDGERGHPSEVGRGSIHRS